MPRACGWNDGDSGPGGGVGVTGRAGAVMFIGAGPAPVNGLAGAWLARKAGRLLRFACTCAPRPGPVAGGGVIWPPAWLIG